LADLPLRPCIDPPALAQPIAMDLQPLAKLHAAIRDVPNFPKPGIIFKDITPILADPALFQIAINSFVEATRVHAPTKIVGIDARGFLFGAAVAYELEIGFVPIRKKGKLPYTCQSAAYELEYGEAVVEMHIDALAPGERVVLIDDLLATGGTAAAANRLIQQVGAEVVQALFLIELNFLEGRKRLSPTPVHSFLEY
jgi:adenine phosphoribosyltransferase